MEQQSSTTGFSSQLSNSTSKLSGLPSALSSLVQRIRIPLQEGTLITAEPHSYADSSRGTRSDPEQQKDTNNESGETIQAQQDILPVPPLPHGPRKWGAVHLFGYWIAEAFSISQYQVASSSIVAGLSPGATIGAVFLGHVLVSIACALNGYIGTLHGINFPVLARASFGIRGNTIAIASRAIAAIIWFGTQTYQGGLCVRVMLGAIWPSFYEWEGRHALPGSAGVGSGELLCFFIFFIVQLPLLYIHISNLRYLFLVKVIVMPIFGFTLFGWSVARAHGFGPIFNQPPHHKPGSPPTAVLFFMAMTSAIAPKSTMALNICDFTRYAKSPRTVVWTNITSLCIPVTLCAILGVFVTSATQQIYGVQTWNPLEVSLLWNNRPAAFFSALCWSLAAVTTNISANSTAVGNDLAAPFPSYVNIRRGQYICAVLGVASCPWLIQNTAKSFTAFLAGYSIFLGPIAGVLLSDYYIYRRQHLNIPALYTSRPPRQSMETSSSSYVYWYTHGFNLRAIAAFVLGVLPSLPGFAKTVNPRLDVPSGARDLFSVVWPLGVVVSSLVYVSLSVAFPPMSPFSETSLGSRFHRQRVGALESSKAIGGVKTDREELYVERVDV